MDTLKENEGVNCWKGCGECYALWNRNNNLRAAPWSRNSILTSSGTKKKSSDLIYQKSTSNSPWCFDRRGVSAIQYFHNTLILCVLININRYLSQPIPSWHRPSATTNRWGRYANTQKNESTRMKTQICFYIFVLISGILTQPTLKIPKKKASMIGFFLPCSSHFGDSKSTYLSPKFSLKSLASSISNHGFWVSIRSLNCTDWIVLIC